VEAAAAAAVPLSLRACKGARAQAASLGGAADKDFLSRMKGQQPPLCQRRSPVHGWGLYAAGPIAANVFVIEYIGELLRRPLDDVREKRYEAQGRDDYLFRLDNDWVVDATVKGNKARFINHACDPNCYSDIKQVSGTNHICIFTKRAIATGEELCYDYKFPFQPDQPPVPCSCGSRNCRRRMN
jgi:SET domain-containing protein